MKDDTSEPGKTVGFWSFWQTYVREGDKDGGRTVGFFVLVLALIAGVTIAWCVSFTAVTDMLVNARRLDFAAHAPESAAAMDQRKMERLREVSKMVEHISKSEWLSHAQTVSLLDTIESLDP